MLAVVGLGTVVVVVDGAVEASLVGLVALPPPPPPPLLTLLV